jgi:hypothetical protein
MGLKSMISITDGGEEKSRKLGAVIQQNPKTDTAQFSGALLGSDGEEHGPTLFYVIAAAMRTEDFAFLVFGSVSTFENVFLQAWQKYS